MKKQNQLIMYFLLVSMACTAQVTYWAGNMRLYRLDSCRANTIQVTVGAGISIPTPATKAVVSVLNTRDVLVAVYLPMGADKGRRKPFFTYGLHVGFTYALGYGKNGFSNISPYNINTQRQAPSLTTGSTSHVMFRFETGPRLNFRLGNFVLSPVFGLGFAGVKQGAFEVEQITRATNAAGLDTTLRFNLYAQGVTKTYGLAFLPRLRLSYRTHRLGIWAEGQYTWGPTINRDATAFIPQGPANPVTGAYTINQIQQGTTAAVKGGRGNYQSWGIGLGVSWSLKACGKKPRARCGCNGK